MISDLRIDNGIVDLKVFYFILHYCLMWEGGRHSSGEVPMTLNFSVYCTP